MGLPNHETSIALAKFNGLIFETNDIETEIKLLTEQGISFGKIEQTPWGQFAWMKDLDGNSICLHKK